MRLGLNRVCVADVGLPLAWPVPPIYQLLKQEVLPRLINPLAAEHWFSLDDFPGQYAYSASEWQDDAGSQTMLLEKHH